jgi:hypothetical protein
MTLCIAAELKHKDDWAVVHCCDSRQEKGGIFQELVGSDDATKITRIGTAPSLSHALISGIPTRAWDLIASCKKDVLDFQTTEGGLDSDLEMTKFLSGLRSASSSRKKQIISHHVEMSLGMSLTEFLDTAKDRFPADHYNQLWGEIRNLDLGTDLIFSGFQGKSSFLVRLDRFGQTHWEEGYSVTGVGSDIALAFLCQREYSSYQIALMDCLFRVYEAKKAAERNRHVGEMTLILIAVHGKGRLSLTGKGWDVLEKAVDTKKVPEFNEDLFELDPR